MFTRRISQNLYRALIAVVLLAVVALALPQPVSAAVPTISVISAKADELVTIRTDNFPQNVNFTVRMDRAGNMAIDGIVVGQTNSGIGGAFEVTYRIPAELRGVQTIAIRMESVEGYYAFDWFNNRTFGSTTPVPTPTPNPVPVTGGKPYLSFLGVKANDSVTVEARSLPAYTTFTVRVGPYYTFSRDYVFAPSFTSDANGYARFTISLPDVVEGVELVTVRIDGGGHYAYNAFKNVDDGTVIPVTSTSSCQVVSVSPGGSISPNGEFDAIWTIKNTSGKTWDGNSVDYKFVSGTKMEKRDVYYFDLHQTVKSGETVKVIVDMVAPAGRGYYTSNWALVMRDTTICSLPFTLRVK